MRRLASAKSGFVVRDSWFGEIGALKRARFLVNYAPTHSRYSVVVAQRFCKPLVGGSNPSAGSNEKPTKTPFLLGFFVYPALSRVFLCFPILPYFVVSIYHQLPPGRSCRIPRQAHKMSPDPPPRTSFCKKFAGHASRSRLAWKIERRKGTGSRSCREARQARRRHRRTSAPWARRTSAPSARRSTSAPRPRRSCREDFARHRKDRKSVV